jgi:hypothetical protein
LEEAIEELKLARKEFHKILANLHGNGTFYKIERLLSALRSTITSADRILLEVKRIQDESSTG